MLKIKTYNHISDRGLALFGSSYTVGSTITDPDAILLRSQDLHTETIPASVKVIARAGAGVNNIPIDKMTAQGIPVLNTPGANANAVKELVLAGLLLSARHICEAWDFARHLTPGENATASFQEQVEQEKKRFAGIELPGRTLGIVGLGHIGVKVANAAVDLGMKVVGYDPAITIKNAWQLSSQVLQAPSLDFLLSESQFVSLHVPLSPKTHKLINQDRFKKMQKGAILLNFAREEIVDREALLEALQHHAIGQYVCDFPHPSFLNHPQVLALPHLGASTEEAQENCAVMAVEQLKNFLETGEVTHAVNFPDVRFPKRSGYRLVVLNRNIPNMVAQVSRLLSKENLNIMDMINQSAGDFAYNLLDLDAIPQIELVHQIQAVEGVVRAYLIAEDSLRQ